MKKTLTLLSLLLCLQFITAQAQQNIYVWKQGSVSVMTTSDVDSITFDAGSWFYTISCSTPVDVSTTSAKAIVLVRLGTGVKSVDATPEIGVCFSEDSQFPTIQDHKVVLGSSEGNYTVTMEGCDPGTSYWYRPYVTLGDQTIYYGGNRFTTLGYNGPYSYFTVYGHEFVDLGLPSGLKWATCNVGANTPGEDGDYFAWGEVKPKSNYSWATYKWYDGNYYYDFANRQWYDFNGPCSDCSGFTKYPLDNVNFREVYLDPEDDAATQNWGLGCYMPSNYEFGELYQNCTRTWTEMYGVYGYKFTSKINGAFVFFPASGAYSEDRNYSRGSFCGYWMNCLAPVYGGCEAYCLYFDDNYEYYDEYNWSERFSGFTVRAVTYLSEEPSYTTVSGREFVDMGLPSGLKWAACNVGANTPDEDGDHFAWGEVEPKSVYNWDNYKWRDGNNYTKYTKNGKTTLDAEDDAATLNWGDGCRMPTVDEFEELFNNCIRTWAVVNGVLGYKFTSKTNSAFIFFPASGCREDVDLRYHGLGGFYWSSSLISDAHRLSSCTLCFDDDECHLSGYPVRYYGFSVRAVCP